MPKSRRRSHRNRPTDAQIPSSSSTALAQLAETFGFEPDAAGADWQQPAADRLIEEAAALTAAQGPRELEQRTAELIGAALHRTLEEERAGLDFAGWLGVVVRTAAARGTEEPAWLLLNGITAIAPPELRMVAWKQVGKLRKTHRDAPEWLSSLAKSGVSGMPQLLRDAYGSRFGLLFPCGFPAAGAKDGRKLTADPYVLLLDVDACGVAPILVGGGAYDTAHEAADGWRAGVGASAAAAEIGDPDPLLLAELFADIAWPEHVMGDEGRTALNERFRGARRAQETAALTAKASRSLPETGSRYVDTGAERWAEQFGAWRTARGLPSDAHTRETTALLAEEWFAGSFEQTRFACSPHRVAMFREITKDVFLPEAVESMFALLPDWVRWCAEQTGLDERFLAPALAITEGAAFGYLHEDGTMPSAAAVPEL
jgi:hypothetical protein